MMSGPSFLIANLWDRVCEDATVPKSISVIGTDRPGKGGSGLSKAKPMAKARWVEKMAPIVTSLYDVYRNTTKGNVSTILRHGYNSSTLYRQTAMPRFACCKLTIKEKTAIIWRSMFRTFAKFSNRQFGLYFFSTAFFGKMSSF